MKILSIVSILVLFLVSCSEDGDRSFIKLKNAALSSQSDTNPYYWFSKTNRFSGKNDPVMLVFGYAENGNVCNLLLVMAKKDNPDQNFQCSQVIP